MCCIRNTMSRMQHAYVAYATSCCVCNTHVSHMQHNVAYATSECCIRNIVSRMQHIFTKKTIFLKKSQMKYFSLIRPWFMPVWSKPNWRETWSNMNKAGYTAIQSRTVGREQYCINRSQFINISDGGTDGPPDTARWRVACPWLKSRLQSNSETTIPFTWFR